MSHVQQELRDLSLTCEHHVPQLLSRMPRAPHPAVGVVHARQPALQGRSHRGLAPAVALLSSRDRIAARAKNNPWLSHAVFLFSTQNSLARKEKLALARRDVPCSVSHRPRIPVKPEGVKEGIGRSLNGKLHMTTRVARSCRSCIHRPDHEPRLK